MKKFFGILMAAAMLCTVFSVFPSAAALTMTDGKYVISTAEQLILFSDLVNGEGSYEGVGDPAANAVLAADIVLTNGLIDADGNPNQAVGEVIAWQPIGFTYGGKTVEYSGTFDGAGHTVTGIYTAAPTGVCMGFFGITSTDAVIKDLTLHNSFIYGNDTVGAIVGDNKGTVTGCTVTHTRVDGIACENGAGGIAGRNTGTVTDCKSAAIVSSDGFTGGIVGISSTPIVYCQNDGEITSFNGSAAGIAATAPGADKCLNTAVISGMYATAGIIGTCSADITDSLSYGSIMYDSDYEGWYGVGALAGMMSSGAVKNSYYKATGITSIGCDADKTSVPDASDVYKVSNADLIYGKVSYKLGFGFGQVLDGASKPVLSNERVYMVEARALNGAVSGNCNAIYASGALTASTDNDELVFCGWYEGDTRLSAAATYTIVEDIDRLTAAFAVKGDADHDGYFTSKDILYYKLEISSQPHNGTVVDLNGDGVIDSADIDIILGKFGPV